MSSCAASTPSICLSVSAICLTGLTVDCCCGAGAVWVGGAGLACASASPANAMAIAAARQTTLSAATGRTNSCMEVPYLLSVRQERPERMVQTTLAEPGGKSWPKHISFARGKTNGRGLAPRRELIRGKQHTEKLLSAQPAN